MRPKLLVSLVLVLALGTASDARQWSYKKTLATITVGAAAAAVFTAADVQAGSGHVAATLAQCTLQSANIRVTTDGTTPTTSLGQVLTPGSYDFKGPDILLNLTAIRDDSTNASLDCVLYGQ